MVSPKLLLLDNALDHKIYRPVEHWSKALGFVPDHVHVPSGMPLPPAGAHTHVILSGSEASIVERAHWAEAERRWVQKSVEQGVQILGSCWGHQLLAVALGGPACVRRAVRTEIGWLRIEVLDSGSILPSGNVGTFVFHFDEVIAGSHPAIRILAQSAACAVHAFRWGDLPVWGIQAHPEINPETARDFLQSACAFWPDQASLFRKALTTPACDTGSITDILHRFLAS